MYLCTETNNNKIKMRKFYYYLLTGILLLTASPGEATKFLGLKVIDKNYLMVHFRDGEVHYRDDGTGPSAYLGHSFAEGDDTLVVFGERLKTTEAQKADLWQISSEDDKTFATAQPIKVWRKSKPMNTDHTLTSECDHWLFLQLSQPMKQGCNYTVSIPKGIGSDQLSSTICFDIWNQQSEAIHVNIIGYSPTEQTHAADLYQWLGDGGQRDYKAWEGRKVYLYNVKTKKKQNVGTVKFWKKAADSKKEAGEKNLVGTDVWNVDFKSATPGRYRLVVEDVGCSMDFDIASNIYFQPFRYSVRGYYYMRLGEPKDPEHVWPIPRQPQFIPETDPKGFTVYKTDFHPFCQEWRDLHTDVWDEPHFKGIILSAKSDSVLNLVKADIMKFGADTLTDALHNKYGNDIRMERMVVKKGENTLADYLAFHEGDKPERKGYEEFIILEGGVIAQPEEMADVRGAVTSDYQDVLEQRWKEELARKYPAKINKKVLKQVK